MSQQTVLYDAPGPRARLITLVSSIVVGLLALVGAYFLIYQPLKDKGQLSAEMWAPIINPSSDEFQPVWRLIFKGWQATLTAAALAIVLSLVFGLMIAVLRIQVKSLAKRRFVEQAPPLARLLRYVAWTLNVVTRFYVEVFRGIPVLITIFFVWVALPQFGISTNTPLWPLVIGLTIYNSIVIAEIIRSGMEGLPPGQRESAEALGLSPFQTTRMILLPQAVRIMLPALISQLVVVLKDTSLGFLIQYDEVLRTASNIIGAVDVPNLIPMYVTVGVMYIAINYALSKLAEYVQRRLARGRKTRDIEQVAAPSTALVSQASGGT